MNAKDAQRKCGGPLLNAARGSRRRRRVSCPCDRARINDVTGFVAGGALAAQQTIFYAVQETSDKKIDSTILSLGCVPAIKHNGNFLLETRGGFSAENVRCLFRACFFLFYYVINHVLLVIRGTHVGDKKKKAARNLHCVLALE